MKEQVLRSAVTVDYCRERKSSLPYGRSRFDDLRIKLVALPRRESES